MFWFYFKIPKLLILFALFAALREKVYVLLFII